MACDNLEPVLADAGATSAFTFEPAVGAGIDRLESLCNNQAQLAQRTSSKSKQASRCSQTCWKGLSSAVVIQADVATSSLIVWQLTKNKSSSLAPSPLTN